MKARRGRTGGRPRVFTEDAKRWSFKVEPEDMDRVRRLSRVYGAEQSLILQTAIRVLDKKAREEDGGG